MATTLGASAVIALIVVWDLLHLGLVAVARVLGP